MTEGSASAVPEGLQSIAESLAAKLNRAVAIDDPQIRLLVHTAHDDRVDRQRIASVLGLKGTKEAISHALKQGIAKAEGPVRIPAVPDLDLMARVCIPVRCLGVLLGYLWLIDDDGSLTEDELGLAVEAADAAGDVLFRERLLGDVHRGRDRELLRDLLGEDPSVRQHAAEALVAREDTKPDAGVAVLVVRVTSSGSTAGPESAAVAVDAALQRAARHSAPLTALTMTRAGASGVMLVQGRRAAVDSRLGAAALEVRQDLARSLPAQPVRLGVGPIAEGLGSAHESHRRAQDALRIGEVVPGFDDIVRWEDLGVYRVLVHLPLEQLPPDVVLPGLVRLFESDPLLVDTLETYLDEGGDVRATIQRLCIHRTSLYYRLNRIEEITGMRVKNGGDRLAMHLGLKLARLTGSRSSTRTAPVVPGSS